MIYNNTNLTNTISIMKKQLTILLALLLCFQFAKAQKITTYQYRTVKQSDMNEYIKRETTYWSKLAESEVKKGNLTFWAVLVRVDGVDLDRSPNVLLINTFNDLDASNSIWGGITDLFPNVKMEDMETNSLSKTTARIFLRGLDNFAQGKTVNPDEDFKFVRIIYHNNKNIGKHLTFESEKWKPMIQNAMNEGKTSMKGWGNSIIVSPQSSKFPYNTISYDIFATAHEALSPSLGEDINLPDDFFSDIQDNYRGVRNSHLFRIVQAVSAEPASE